MAIAGHKTSVPREGVFWDTLAEIAATRSVSINRLITEIDRDRNLMTPDGRSGWETEFVLAPGPLMGDPFSLFSQRACRDRRTAWIQIRHEVVACGELKKPRSALGWSKLGRI